MLKNTSTVEVIYLIFKCERERRTSCAMQKRGALRRYVCNLGANTKVFPSSYLVDSMCPCFLRREGSIGRAFFAEPETPNAVNLISKAEKNTRADNVVFTR